MINDFSRYIEWKQDESFGRTRSEETFYSWSLVSRDGLSLNTEQLFESCECLVCKHFLLSDSRARRRDARNRARWKIIKSNFLLCFILARAWFIARVSRPFENDKTFPRKPPCLHRQTWPRFEPTATLRIGKNTFFLFLMTSNTTFAFISAPVIARFRIFAYIYRNHPLDIAKSILGVMQWQHKPEHLSKHSPIRSHSHELGALWRLLMWNLRRWWVEWLRLCRVQWFCDAKMCTPETLCFDVIHHTLMSNKRIEQKSNDAVILCTVNSEISNYNRSMGNWCARVENWIKFTAFRQTCSTTQKLAIIITDFCVID